MTNTLTCHLCEKAFPRGEPGSATFGGNNSKRHLCGKCVTETKDILAAGSLLAEAKKASH